MATQESRLRDVFAAIASRVATALNRALPAGGVTGQVLTKASATDYAATWTDPSTGWTYLRVTSDVSYTTTAGGVVTGLSFTPVVSADYEIEAKLLVRSAATTTGPQVGISLPATLDHGFVITEPSSLLAASDAYVPSSSTSGKNSATAFPAAGASFLAEIRGLLRTTTSVSANVAVTLATEVANSAVTVRAGSFLRYRRTN